MTVAVKVLAEHLTSDSKSIARFNREMKAVGRVSHPNIVRATDAGEYDGKHYLAMEFVDGSDLAQILRANGRLPINDACEGLRQAAMAIQHAHDNGLIHRDLKPSNLMVTKEGQVKVLDLGLARLHAGETEGLTSDFQIMGTADYMAPEQALKALQVDARVDIYSLGCTLYALLCGRAPFADGKHETAISKIMAHEHEQPESVISLRPEVPAALSATIEKAMAKVPSQRYDSASAFADALLPFCRRSDLGMLHRRSQSTEKQTQNQSDTSDFKKHFRIADTKVHSPKIANARPAHEPPKRRMLVALGFVILPFCLLAITVYIRFSGKDVRVRVEGDDDVKVVIEREPIADQSAESEPIEFDGSNHRVMANWALSKPSIVSIVANGETRFVQEVDALPTGAFELKGINYTKPFVPSDEDFEHLAQSPTLNHLEFTDLELSDRVVTRLIALPQLNNLRLRFDNISPRNLQRIAELPFLSDLTIGGEWIGDDDLAMLTKLKNAVHLTISGKKVTDAGLIHLSEMRHLQFLSFIFANIRGDSLKHLSGLSNVWSLQLPYTELDDRGGEALSKLPGITWLNLGFTQVGDESLRSIAKLPMLEILDLTQTKVTNGGIEALQPIASLRTLHLGATQIDDDAVDSLSKLTQLTTLSVGNRLSTDAIEVLQNSASGLHN
ncbi:MAG: protein kinase [Pirellulaceae bacterium]